jgi:hypothetical protein
MPRPIPTKAGGADFAFLYLSTKLFHFVFREISVLGERAEIPEGMHVFDRRPPLCRSSCAGSASPSDLGSRIGDAKTSRDDFVDEKPQLYLSAEMIKPPASVGVGMYG